MGKIWFYITKCEGFLLLGNESLHQSNQSGPESILHIPENARKIDKHSLLLRTFFDPTSPSQKEVRRTYLLVVPTKSTSYHTFMSVQFFLVSNV